jgi:hypothetical protein
MAQMTIIQPVTTKDDVFDGPLLDISHLDYFGDWTLVGEVLTSGPDTKACFRFDDTEPTQGNFLPPFTVGGGITDKASVRFTFRKHDYPVLQLGVVNQSIRLRLLKITGTNPTVTYRAWLEE